MGLPLPFTWLSTVGIIRTNDTAVGGVYITHEEIDKR